MTQHDGSYDSEAWSGDALTDRATRIVAAHRLLRKSRRAQAGEFLADGAQAVREAVAAEKTTPGTVLELFVTATAAQRYVDIVRAALAVGIRVTEVTDRAAARVSDAVTPQGITARCTLPSEDPTALLLGAPKLLAVLVENSDPGNAGTVIRLADAAGADGVIVAGNAVDPWGQKAVRASVGSIFHLPVVRADDPLALLADLRDAGMSLLATTGLETPPGGKAPVMLEDARASGLLAGSTAWLLGSEAHGLPAEVIEAADNAISIPLYGQAESLNLATAAALCLYASAGVHHG